MGGKTRRAWSSEANDFGMIAGDASQNVASIHDDLGFREHASVIDALVIGHDDDGVVFTIRDRIGHRFHDDARFLDLRNVRIEILHVGAEVFQGMDDIESG